MGNMSYCRFENTAQDLRDCLNNLDDDLTQSLREVRARIELVKLCQRIVGEADMETYEDELKEAKENDKH